ncbi:MAG: SIS domain-containing protein [Actinobacteria bacterium]|nr:SIS domain-containing protein [Actinomycetota bacterium]
MGERRPADPRGGDRAGRDRRPHHVGVGRVVGVTRATGPVPHGRAHLAALAAPLAALEAEVARIDGWGRHLSTVLTGGGRLLAAGNGGSAAQAQHLTSELVGRYRDDRQAFSAISLCVEASSVTAIANDYGNDDVFARQVRAHGRPGDVLVVLSTSGCSPNVLTAAAAGRAAGLTVWALTGAAPNPLLELADDALVVDAPATATVQEVHQVAVHLLCAAVDTALAVLPSVAGAGDRCRPEPPEAPATPAIAIAHTPAPAPAPAPSRSLSDLPPPRWSSRQRTGRVGGNGRRRRERLVVVGDALLDRDLDGSVERLAPDAPVPVVDAPVERTRPGGAALAASLAAADGADVVLVTALADDEPGRRLADLLERAGVEVVDLGLDGRTPEKVRVQAGGRTLVRVDHGGAPGTVGAATAGARTALDAAGAVLVADYGRGVAADAGVRRSLARLLPHTSLVWDPHPRGPEPVAGLRLATPNASEAARLVPQPPGSGTAAVATRARALADRWQAGAVAVTLGSRGALLVGPDGPPLAVPAPFADGDPCGAGDRFASAAAVALARGSLVSEAVEEAVHVASAFVAAGGAAGFSVADLATEKQDGDVGPVDAVALAARVRREGGTVVATGGCFDLLHAGHVHMLQAARSLGDCLLVCLNADESVHRLKGPDRPLQSQDDRAAVLAALDCVDAVMIFDEDTPVQALEQLRPHVFAKGADYAVADLPEARSLARWGGEAVVLPYLQGRSTSRLMKEAVRRAR